MSSLAVPVLLLLVSVPLVVALLRANELFVVRYRGRKLERVRGKIPAALLHELEDVLQLGSGEAKLRGVVEDRRARLYAEGDLTEDQKQRLRNVIGMWPVTRIRGG